jgi:hypothetical protein
MKVNGSQIRRIYANGVQVHDASANGVQVYPHYSGWNGATSQISGYDDNPFGLSTSGLTITGFGDAVVPPNDLTMTQYGNFANDTIIFGFAFARNCHLEFLNNVMRMRANDGLGGYTGYSGNLIWTPYDGFAAGSISTPINSYGDIFTLESDGDLSLRIKFQNGSLYTGDYITLVAD